jgi:hypothetical protein
MPRKSTNTIRKNRTHQQRRPAHSRQWWLEKYEAWQNSGLSKTHYCSQEKLNLSTFVNWTTRFERDVHKDKPDLALPPAFFKATPHSNPPQAGVARSLTLGELSVTFDQPLNSQALAGWVEVLKRC